MKENKKSSKIVNLSDLAFERDKKEVNKELTDYFVKKNRQVKAAQLISAMKSSLKKKLFSGAEAKKFAALLAIKYDIRGPAIQYAQAGYLSPVPAVANDDSDLVKKRRIKRKSESGGDFFREFFLRLQVAVQENLLDYNGARVLVREIVISYPAAKDSLIK
ncbi:MAG: hypothetical protein ACI8ZB_000244 [Desulforhopalus sp.]|jgi:hypothetical protein